MINLGPLGLYEDINDARPRARDLCTSYATENTDYLTIIPLLGNLKIKDIFKDEAKEEGDGVTDALSTML